MVHQDHVVLLRARFFKRFIASGCRIYRHFSLGQKFLYDSEVHRVVIDRKEPCLRRFKEYLVFLFITLFLFRKFSHG